MKIGSTIAFALMLVATVAGDELPRKTRTLRESYPNVDVIYDFVTAADGERLRTIITKPHDAKGKLPVIFVAGWLSCDSVEAPEDTKDASGMVFRGLAQTPGFSLFRVDKQGVGDSEGVCSDTDFESELAGYRAAFRSLKRYDFIDVNRVYILGISNGGGFAPLVADLPPSKHRCRLTSQSAVG
jgi:pimeloyl-ACP methyl ester carboxylesterase